MVWCCVVCGCVGVVSYVGGCARYMCCAVLCFDLVMGICVCGGGDCKIVEFRAVCVVLHGEGL